MRFVVGLFDCEGGAIADSALRAYETFPRSRGLAYQWTRNAQMTVLVGGDELQSDPLAARDGANVAVGAVRLDNRDEVERWAGSEKQEVQRLSDLELVLRMIVRQGAKHLPGILGDFAFLVWNAYAQTGVAMVDPFAIKKLYFTRRGSLFAFASRAEALALNETYDVQYLAELVAATPPTPGLTPYAGVRAVPAGNVAVLERGYLHTRQYWSAFDFEFDSRQTMSERQAAEACRDLLAQSVRLRLTGNEDTWAQLSGGLDSSAVVSLAQWHAERGTVSHGLAGTVSYVDRQGTGADEREYSDAVVSRWGLRNETIINPPVWQDEVYPPPRTDQPRLSLMLYPRDLRFRAIVKKAGGKVILTGMGSDELFTGTMFFFADWLARGRVLPALREMARRAAIGRASFWELAYRNALLPLLPSTLLHRLPFARDRLVLAPWLRRDVARRYKLRERDIVAAAYAGRVGHKYHHAVVANLVTLCTCMDYETIAESFDVRHPFLYRPLVEFALQLPPELCARPQARKWILREAMRGILPETVRTRIGKATPGDLMAWSLATQRELLEPLVHNPILADLGIVDSTKLRSTFEAAPQRPARGDNLHDTVQHTLTIEAWLQLRSGRWPRGRHATV